MSDVTRLGKTRIRMSTGDTVCYYCHDPIKEGKLEVVTEHDIHYHLLGGHQCEGWIFHEWNFITSLLFQLADIGGDDYTDTIRMLISLWEEDES